MVEVSDPYGDLGLCPGASAAEVATAYRRKSLLVHPDRCPGDPLAATKFARLSAAKDILLDNAKKFTAEVPAKDVNESAPEVVQGPGRVRPKRKAAVHSSPKKKAKAPAVVKAKGRASAARKKEEEGLREDKEEEAEAPKSRKVQEGAEDAEERSAGRAAASSSSGPGPAKRPPKVSSSPRTPKKPRKVHVTFLERLAEALQAAEVEVPEVNLAARQLLVGMCTSLGDEAFQTPRERHPFEQQLFSMVSEALASLEPAFRGRAAAAASRAADLAADAGRLEELSREVENREHKIAATQLEVARLAEQLSTVKKVSDSAKAAEKDTNAQVASLMKQEVSLQQQKALAEDGLAAFSALESQGAVSKGPQLRKQLKLVESQLEAARVSETLFARAQRAVLPALQLEPSGRSRTDEAALAAAEGCLKEYMKERTQELSELAGQLRMGKLTASRAESSASEAAKRLSAVEESLRTAKEELKELKASHRTAQEELLGFKRERADAAALSVETARSQENLERLRADLGRLLESPAAETKCDEDGEEPAE